MKNTTFFLSAILISLFMILGCSKKSDDNPSLNIEPYIQFDGHKNTPVTQKTDPYNRGQLYSCFFATTTLDLTEKTGSSEAIVQVILTYSVPEKTLAESDILAKAFFDGIAEGNKITAKILGEDSRLITPTAGFELRGSISAAAGIWEYFYNEKADAAIEISKVNGKIQFRLTSPLTFFVGKRQGAGNPAYPEFTSTGQFSIQISL